METKKRPAQIDGTLRKFALRVPEAIYECSGIIVFGKRIKSLVFSTDLSIIKNVNADAIIAVYPFTPQPVITQALLMAADIPVFVGVGGGLTQGQRVVNLAMFAEMQGATGVVLNAPTANEVLRHVADTIDIPTVVTVARDDTDFDKRIEAGTSIFNVSAAAETPKIVKMIREKYPDIPIIATGGPTDESIRETIKAGANAITWTPPSNGEIFRDIMAAYRENKPHP
ncbi:MAG: hydrolase [Clostridia bacterium]|nr:hydrolase [Clostridia bacterium]